MPVKFRSGSLDRELPFNLYLFFRSFFDNVQDLIFELSLSRDSSLEALFGQGRELYFNHVKPTGRFWGEVKFKPLCKFEGLLSGENLIESGG